MTLHQLLTSQTVFRPAFLGGSITEGAGASRTENRYSSRVTNVLARRYPDVKLEEINAGVGGTPSALGLFRLRRDVLEKDPDVLFVEFAVNDDTGEGCEKYMEGIVREALRFRRDLPIVFVYTFATRMYDDYLAGDTPPAVRVHHRVAEYYNIPEINLGPDLAAKIRNYGGDWHFFMQDGAHPNDAGYACYTDTIIRELFTFDFAIRFPETTLSGVDYLHPRMELASRTAFPGWGVSRHSLYGRTKDYVYASLPGTALSYAFDGCAIGAYITIEKDSGNADVEIDGKFVKTVSTWDEYALQFNRSAFVMLAEDLAPGHHTLTITVRSDKAELSEGYFIRIGAFLVG